MDGVYASWKAKAARALEASRAMAPILTALLVPPNGGAPEDDKYIAILIRALSFIVSSPELNDMTRAALMRARGHPKITMGSDR